MQALLDVNQSGAYLLMSVGGSAALRRHLAEMGLAIVKKLTVVQPFAMDDHQPAVALGELALNQVGLIRTIKGDPPLRHRLMDMGLTKGTLVKIHQIAPLGDPIELAVRGYKLSIRKQDAAHVLVTEVGADGHA